MIDNAKNDVGDNSFYFLFWGWITFVACMLQYGLHLLHSPYHYYVWFLMPLGGILTGIYGTRQRKKQRTKTIVKQALTDLWSGLGLAFLVVIFINIKTGWQNAFLGYILLYAIGTFISGRILRFRPLIIGGLINFGLVIVACFFTYFEQGLISGVAILISYIIPGHMLRAHYKNRQP